MPYKKNLWITFILLLISTLPIAQCKKNSTTPNMDILSSPIIWLNTNNITFTASANGANPQSQILQIKNSGQQTLNYALSSESEWVSIVPTEGSSSGQTIEHTISVNKTGLAPQDEDYTAKIQILCDQAFNNPQEVVVSLKVTEQNLPPEIWVNTKNLSFNAQEGGPNPPSQQISIKNSREGILRYTISADAAWLTVNPLVAETQTALKTHTVITNTSGLTPGTYNGTITIACSDATNSPQKVNVSLNVTKESQPEAPPEPSPESPPEIQTDRNTLSFNAVIGGPSPPSKSFYVKNSGGGTLNYSIDCDAPWLSVNPTTGSSAGATKQHTASVIISGLSAGTHTGTITITDPAASNSPQTIMVTLNISSVLTDNDVGITMSPKEGGTDTIVTITVNVKGNTSPLSDGFGLKLHYDAAIFQYQSTARGTLTSNWAAVDGNANSGTIIVGGFRGSGTTIPTGSQGSIAVIQLKVIHNGSSDLSRTITMDSITDDLVGMTIAPASQTFTYRD